MATNPTQRSTSSPTRQLVPKQKTKLQEDTSASSGLLSSPQVHHLTREYDWVVIGNGPHGNIFARTLREKGLPADKLVIVDPLDSLELWTKTNTNGGWSRNAEEVSRETDVSQSTSQYQTLSKIPLPITNRNLFEFLEGLRSDISRLSIPHIKALATAIQRADGGYAVNVREGSPINAKNVVLAIGNYTEPVWPEWAKKFKTENQSANIHHIFDQEFSLDEFKKDWKDVVIVGGGPAAVNLALILSQIKPGKVTLLMRHPMRGTGVSLVDPCHLPEAFEANYCYKTFMQLPSSEARRKYIEENRPIGAVGKSVDFMAALDRALEEGRLKVIQGETESATATDEGIQLKLKPKTSGGSKIEEGIDFIPYLSDPTGKIRIDTSITDLDLPIEYQPLPVTVTNTGKVIIADEDRVDPDILRPYSKVAPSFSRPVSVTLMPKTGVSHSGQMPNLSTSSVLLATGFVNRRPGGEFVDRLISDLNLKVYPDGYPKVDEALQWSQEDGEDSNIFVMGRLADHRVGPYAWNVAGGIFATKRILDSKQVQSSLNPSESESLSLSIPRLRLLSSSMHTSPQSVSQQSHVTHSPETDDKPKKPSYLSRVTGLLFHRMQSSGSSRQESLSTLSRSDNLSPSKTSQIILTSPLLPDSLDSQDSAPVLKVTPSKSNPTNTHSSQGTIEGSNPFKKTGTDQTDTI
jgi:lysine/ornithine N-monooxygenase